MYNELGGSQRLSSWWLNSLCSNDAMESCSFRLSVGTKAHDVPFRLKLVTTCLTEDILSYSHRSLVLLCSYAIMLGRKKTFISLIYSVGETITL